MTLNAKGLTDAWGTLKGNKPFFPVADITEEIIQRIIDEVFPGGFEQNLID